MPLNRLFLHIGSLALFAFSEGVDTPLPLNKAENLFEEASYMDACPLYEKALQATSDNKELLAFIQSRLAVCYLEMAEDQKVVDLFSSQYRQEHAYLLAAAHRHLHQYQTALDILANADPSNEVNLEQGLNYFYLNDVSKALRHLQAVAEDAAPCTYYLAQLYLARLHLQAKKLVEAQTLLNGLETHLPESHPLNLERSYLKGLTFFYLQKYSEAIHQLEKAASKHQLASDWLPDTLYYLAYSYLKAGEMEKNAALFFKSENLLQQALSYTNDKRLQLALADLYAAWSRTLQEDHARSKLFPLLVHLEKPEQPFLLIASAASNYLERDRLYGEFTQMHPLYAQGWYLKGVNAFNEGMAQMSEDAFRCAAQAFERSYALFKHMNPPLALTSLKYQALAYYYQKKPETIQLAWQILSQVLQNREQLSALNEPEEFFYLAALIGSEATPISQDVFTLLEEGLALNMRPDWSQKFFKLAGTIYFQNQRISQADETFSRLIDTYPESDLYCEAWFWKAKCAEQQKQFDQMRASLREIYEKHPASPYAPQAYLSCYSYREYMQGHRKAFKHLQAMPKLFPDHSLAIIAYYLIGLHYKKDPLSSIDAFSKAEALFDDLSARHLIPSDEVNYLRELRYRAQLERALANLAIANASEGAKKQIFLDYTEEVLRQLQTLLDPAYLEILGQAGLTLTEVYLQQGEEDKAASNLEQALLPYKDAHIHQGYTLSRLWEKKGQLAFNQHQYTKALDHFNQSEAAAQGLSPDQKLELWIQQGLCHRELGRYEEAMRILSKVVNDEIASSLRVKAMFLRAEVYELQGKPELAFKQLEAVSKKGGEWAKKAKEKLEIHGYD